MKHNLKITLILISMFIITQLIGIFVINVYQSNQLPYGMDPSEEIKAETSLFHIFFSFILAISLFILLTKIRAEKFIRAWFFVVTIIAISLSINAFFLFRKNLIDFNFIIPCSIIAIIISFPLAYFKIYKRNIYVHNLTELLIYPGIAAIFVPILNVLGIILLLLAISLYDIWAVWHTEFMSKMANYQISNLKIFTGFFLPYAGKKEKQKIKKIKEKYKNKSEKFLEKKFKDSKIKVNLAILGGGDVIFPIISAGVFLKYFGTLSYLIISFFSIIALLSLFLLARQKKFYPAMPFLTIGIYLGMIVNWFLMSN